jgi:hypothetical protein
MTFAGCFTQAGASVIHALLRRSHYPQPMGYHCRLFASCGGPMLGAREHIYAGRAGISELEITPLLLQQLRAIRSEQFGGRIFAKPAGSTISIDRLCKSVLFAANLSQLVWQSVTAWSLRQSIEIRRSIATLPVIQF